MVDAPDSKSGVLWDVGVRNPPPAPYFLRGKRSYSEVYRHHFIKGVK